MATLVITNEGITKTIEISEEESILEAGLREGLDLPYSCMSGICTACMAQKLEGEVEMDGAEAIDEEDIKAGKILTCCSYVKSESVKVNYDQDE